MTTPTTTLTIQPVPPLQAPLPRSLATMAPARTPPPTVTAPMMIPISIPNPPPPRRRAIAGVDGATNAATTTTTNNNSDPGETPGVPGVDGNTGNTTGVDAEAT
jgi:hypothetical protein